MDRELYKASIMDPNVPDEEILEMMKEEVVEPLDENGVVIPPTEEEIKNMEETGELLWQTRPALMEKYSRMWAEEHAKNCPVCVGRVILEK